MSQKRRTEEPDSPCDKRSRRFPTLKSVIEEVIKTQTVQWLEQILEPSIRRVVKEEVEHAIVKHFASIKRSYGKEAHPSDSRSLHLQFLNAFSLPVFTGARVEGEGCSNVKIALIDDYGEIIKSGPESSAKVELVVLEGDFDGNEGESWTPEEFKNNIVREREGKKPILIGDVFVNLKDGIASAGEVIFTDNSSWTRSRRFRLGARVVDTFDGIGIKEAKTEAFIVRDHRGVLYKKHYPPSLHDEVWRLEKIGREGAFHKRLTQANIKTVKDFLVQLFVDPSRLRDILGPGMSTKIWEATVEHARTCVLDKGLYLYRPQASALKKCVVFDIMGKLVGLLAEDQYVPVDKLSENEKADAHDLITSASQHWEEVISVDGEASLLDGSGLYDCSTMRTATSSSCRILSNNKGGFNYAEPSASSPDIMSSLYQLVDIRGLDDSPFDDMALRFDESMGDPDQVSGLLNCDTPSLTQDFSNEDHLRYFEPASLSELQSGTSDCSSDLPDRSSDAIGKAQRRWTKLFSVLKWISIRIVVSRNKRRKDLPGSASKR